MLLLHHVQSSHATATLAEFAFVRWLLEPDKPDHLRIDGPDRAATPLTWALGELCTSRRALPADAAAVLGLAPDATVGHAATELLLAVNDPAGPRCRSYRAAAYHLRGLAGLDEVFDGLEATTS